jgi:DNA-binding FadR family transcriptional regulator
MSDIGIVHTEAMAEMSVRRVRKAYEQVADQIRELIVTGELPPARKLPNEATLARDFGVSRATIREALRVLSTQNLVRTSKGTGGGSFVTLPTIADVSEFVSANLSLLSQTENVSLDELLEARELLEVAAARLAARRAASLHAAVHDGDFHSALVLASGNQLLTIAAQPIFSVLQTSLQRTTLGAEFHTRVDEDHRAIADAVDAGDEEAAARSMHEHLTFLRPMYERAWRQKT